MGLILLFRGGVANPLLKSGYAVSGLFGAGADAVVFTERGFGRAALRGSGYRQDTTVVTLASRLPGITYQVAFDSQPLTLNPLWESLDRVREMSSRRGRAYEFDRIETGTLGARLSNNDAALTPGNTASQYTPILSTRPVRAILQWLVPYDMFRGISEGFPQTYQSFGKDAFVQLNASDLFYGLNNTRFVPGSTTLTVAMSGGVVAGTEQTITVSSTALPMPQSVPFDIRVAGVTDEWPVETMTVTAITGATTYTVTRSDDPTYEHPISAVVETDAVSFGPALSGTRIQQVLQRVGFTSSWYDLDVGQSLISGSEDLSQVSPLEHINLVTEAEFGRFFVSRAGLFTFRDRHSIILDHLSAVFTFTDGAVTAAGEVPFVLEGELSHSEDKLYNRVRITIQGGDYDGQVVDVFDQDSIDEHFERVFEKTYPYANLNDASSAALYVLARYSEAQIRLPAIAVRGAVDPTNLWPKLLAREIGDRVQFVYQPEGGGDPIDKDLAIDGISHSLVPGDHVVRFQCTEVDSNQYWILGTGGYSELGETTWLGF